MDQTHVDAPRSLVRLTGALLILWASGCSMTGDAGPDAPADVVAPAPTAIVYTVAPGDALAAIAARFTGDATAWRSIAAHNGIDDPRRLAVGQRIEIPASLIPAASGDAPAAASDRASRPAAPTTTPRADPVQPPALPVRQEPVVVSAVNANRRFELDPLQQTRFEGADRVVRVIGTYYPIALYTEPRNGSRLAQRVAPGTVLELQREVGDWLQVVAGPQVQYLRRGDGEILSPRDVTTDAEQGPVKE